MLSPRERREEEQKKPKKKPNLFGAVDVGAAVAPLSIASSAVATASARVWALLRHRFFCTMRGRMSSCSYRSKRVRSGRARRGERGERRERGTEGTASWTRRRRVIFFSSLSPSSLLFSFSLANTPCSDAEGSSSPTHSEFQSPRQ